MKRSSLLWAAVALVSFFVIVFSVYLRDITAARRRVSTGSEIVQTKCGAIEYAVRGAGPPVLVVHGAGGGFDQGLLFAPALEQAGYRVIAPSRFGYLRTPLPADASAEAQADAHACLLDALHVERAAVLGVSAGGPSSLHFCLRHADRCGALVLLVPLTYGGKPAERLSPTAAFFIEHTLESDFTFWAASRLARGGMVESILGTPMADVRAAPAAEQKRIFGMLDLILPVSARADGLLNEGKVVQALRPLPLERIAAPAFIASVEDDGYRTWTGAKYTAERIPGARFFSLQRGGHMWVGHERELIGEVTKFLRESTAGVQ